jgi:hypothetical protein
VFMRPGESAALRYTLRPTSRLNVRPNDAVPELGDQRFSGVITSTNFQPIVVEKAMWNAGGVVWAAGTNVTETRMPPS